MVNSILSCIMIFYINLRAIKLPLTNVFFESFNLHMMQCNVIDKQKVVKLN